MLFNLSIKNIKQSFKDYAIYFVTLILGVAIFYIFNALETQSVMLQINDTAKDIVKMMNNILSGVSIFVSFVLGFLIVYANRFLMKRRKREFGIYLTLGMSKFQVSKILIFETIIIGLISLVMGLIVGIGLSQIMSIVVANMFEADMQQFTFVLSTNALFKSCLYFGIMYLLVIVFNTIQVNRQQLLQLIVSHQQSEMIRIKNPGICIIVFIIAVLLLSYAYYNVTSNASSLVSFFSVILQMIYGALATYLIYRSLAGLLLYFIKLKKNTYFKRLNSFTIKQISSKINTAVLSSTVICLLLFLTICIFSSAVALNNTANEEIDQLAPADVCMYIDTKANNITVEQYLKNHQIDISADLSASYSFNTYYSSQLTYGTTYGNIYSDVSESFLNETQRIVKVGDYNQVAKLYHLPEYNLNDNEYVVVGNYSNSMNMINLWLREKPDIVLNDKIYHSKFTQCQNGFLMMQSSPMDMGFFVVPDNAVNNMMIDASYLIGNYDASSRDQRNEIDQKITDYSSDTLIISTKIQIATANTGSGAMVIFIGLYIGIVFLISCAAILALRELSQAIDNKEKYQILRKIGVDEKMINHSIFIQIAIYFLLPLILALIHSIFGLQVCTLMLESVGRLDLTRATLTTAIFLVLIYGGYFVITYWCSKNIIKEN
ncbi:ABC transporter permease [uncultured Thomasclavelia sp.]|uniref:ABC transporter permease n=1 Tax=uncultured Thomasclavelia sp. TaxID=3025759 RepID=UPI0025D25F59|nr:ABC transporter permease [uncultured Thomasclavelia sp.]